MSSSPAANRWRKAAKSRAIVIATLLTSRFVVVSSKISCDNNTIGALVVEFALFGSKQ
jgi:hypothetical protein